MGLLECASGASVWRGYDYYKEKKVFDIEEIDKMLSVQRLPAAEAILILLRSILIIRENPNVTVLMLG